MVSEVLQCLASTPDQPTNTRAILKYGVHAAADEETQAKALPSEHSSAETNLAILLSWHASGSNGAPVEEYEIYWMQEPSKSKMSKSSGDDDQISSHLRDSVVDSAGENDDYDPERLLKDGWELLVKTGSSKPFFLATSNICNAMRKEAPASASDNNDDQNRECTLAPIDLCKPGTTMRFCVRARNQLGWSSFGFPASNPVSIFKVLPPTAPRIATTRRDDSTEVIPDTLRSFKPKDLSPSPYDTVGVFPGHCPLPPPRWGRLSRMEEHLLMQANMEQQKKEEEEEGGKPNNSNGSRNGVTFLDLEWDSPPNMVAAGVEVDSFQLQFLHCKSEEEPSPSAPWKSTASVGGNVDTVPAVAAIGEVVKGGRTAIQGLLPGNRYRFRVRALAFVGWTDWSLPSEVLTTCRRF